jgi:perosamine synthetase
VPELAFLKATDAIADLHARAIVIPGNRGLLVPVCELHADDTALIETLARWRDENQHAFPTRFEVTAAGTALWLRHGLLDRPDRILFLVLDRHGRAIGHMGLANGNEIDNVVRGEQAEPGLMGAALEALLDWAHGVAGLEGIHLRVVHGNERALAFYRRHGFVEDGADETFVHMRCRPEPHTEGTILTAGPSISAREASYALDAARGAWNERAGEYVSRFERAFAEYVGARHALATSSCTGALHLALLALGIGPGDEVIVPELTWVATASAVAYTGATPVFADVQPDGWCIDPESARSLITGRTKAIMPVHLYGHPADMDAVLALAREHGLRVVEDAAPAIGAEVRGRRVGALGDAGGFSFQGAKLLVTGEGGMLVTNDDDLYERAFHLSRHGCDSGRTFWVTRLGLKYRMSDVQAAVGLGQLERVESLIEAKRRVHAWYAERLDGVELSGEAPWARGIHWMTSALVEPAARDELRERLLARGLDTRPVFPAISGYPIWSTAHPPRPVAARIGAAGLNLPSGVTLRRDQVDRVCDVLLDELGARALAA